MNRRFVLTLLGGATLAACSPLATSLPLSRETRQTLRLRDVEVTTEGAAFESARANAYAGRLPRDLRAALLAEFSDRRSDAGAVLQVEIARLNIAGTTATQFGRDQSRLVGNLRLIGDDGALMATYSVTHSHWRCRRHHKRCLGRGGRDPCGSLLPRVDRWLCAGHPRTNPWAVPARPTQCAPRHRPMITAWRAPPDQVVGVRHRRS